MLSLFVSNIVLNDLWRELLRFGPVESIVGSVSLLFVRVLNFVGAVSHTLSFTISSTVGLSASTEDAGLSFSSAMSVVSDPESIIDVDLDAVESLRLAHEPTDVAG